MGQVYRFKVALKHRKTLWRRIEIEGAQTLKDFDRIIRRAFQHDPLDHLSEFYRGRVWEAGGLGVINPSGGGPGAKKRLDRLGLVEGGKLEYVYDFGDDIQHVLTLEKIKDPAEAGAYPRVIAQNKPQYYYCEVCDQEGKKTVATWLCIACSEEEGRFVYLCEDCFMDEKHEDHYAEEVVY